MDDMHAITLFSSCVVRGRDNNDGCESQAQCTISLKSIVVGEVIASSGGTIISA